jgi:hypothetical protein
MTNVSARTDVGRHPIIHAGRFGEQMASADLPGDCIVLGEHDASPQKLTEILERANTLVFLDPPSFPFEAMTADHWDIPIVAVLPSGFDATSLTANFGSALFERLGFFDRIVASDSALWDELRRKYRWAESQRVPVVSEHPSDVAKTVCTLLARGSISPTVPRADSIMDRDPCFDKALQLGSTLVKTWSKPPAPTFQTIASIS